MCATGATIAAALFAYGAYTAALETVAETRRQADAAEAALVAADRPWLRIEGVSVADVAVDPFGITIRLSVKTKNIGRSPALRGLALVEVMPDMLDGEPARLAAPLCRRAAADRNLAEVEGVLFPDGERETHYARFVLPADVQAAVDRIRGRDGAGGGGRPAEPAPERLRTRIAVVGCATYAFHTGRAIGQTAFVYDLARNCGPPPHELPCAFDLSESGSFSGSEIVVGEADFAGFAR